MRRKSLKIKKESADKPGSVVDNHSSGISVATDLMRPTREFRGRGWPDPETLVYSPIWSCSEWGLPCHACCQPRGALLPHHFTLTCTSGEAQAVYFLWHFPW